MEQIIEILDHFDIPAARYRVSRLNQGLINQTFLVLRGTEKKYVLQKINQNVFPNTGAMEQNLELVLPRLHAEDYASLEFRRTRSGDLLYRDPKKELWRLMAYLPGSVTHHCSSDKAVAFEAGRILGVFHRLVSPVNPSDLAVILDRFHHLDYRVEQYEKAAAEAAQSDLKKVEAISRFVSETLGKLKNYGTINFPMRTCHNDTKLNNILFSADQKALCLIDLDTLMPGYFSYDFGDAVRTLANPAPEEERDLTLIKFSLEMFRAFVRGLALNKEVLGEEEIAGLPMSVVYMPFLHGLRAFTDFLQGNRYYEVSYPDENLDRAKSLFHFASLALENQREMKDILTEELH